jgi:glutamate-1-semialdehyde 2,1-aminomutase/spore coat polysaccharide biosynthesis protein SpsF
VAFVQARMGSTRLPGKVLADVCGAPLLARMLERVRAARRVDDVVVLTTTRAADDAVAALATALGVQTYRGSEDDVLDRFVGAARAQPGLGAVVRLTADCPLIDPELIDAVVATFEGDGERADCAGLGGSFPDGLDTEVIAVEALERAWREARLPSEREHVTPYLWKHAERFRLRTHMFPGDAGGLRLSVDEAADLELVRAVFGRLLAERPRFGWRDVVALLADDELRALNAHITRNAGYARSLAAETAEQRSRSAARAADGGRLAPRARSESLWARGRALIPCGTQTLSKGPDQFVRGVYPIYLARGAGSHVFDVDGNEYIDYPMALGAILLGHAYPRVVEAVTAQARDGSVFTLMHPLEVELAARLVDAIPCAEMVRFMKNGSDATSAAIRVARAYTGREAVAYCGYHGWHDWYAITTPRNAGVPARLGELMHRFDYNDLAALERIFARGERLAAVIFEQGGAAPAPGFLEGMRALCDRHGTVLIWDEIVTGFRYALGGAQEYYGVTPDLACVGKAMANGMPLAAVVGRRDLMETFSRVFVSMTFGGEALSLAAAIATIDEIRERDVIGHLWRQGARLTAGLRQAAGEIATLEGVAPRGGFAFRDAAGFSAAEIRSLFLQETLRRGILFGVPIFTTFSHSDDDIAETIGAAAEAFGIVAAALERGDLRARLRGEVAGAVFRPRSEACVEPAGAPPGAGA